jgi:hypothetical protein
MIDDIEEMLSSTDRIVTVNQTDRMPHSVHHPATDEELVAIIARIASFHEGSLLICPFGFYGRESLSCGIEGEYAYAHFHTRDLQVSPGSLWATRPIEKVETMIGFNVGGTLTEIPLHRCIQVETMIRIARLYFNTLSLLPDVVWEPHDAWKPSDVDM